MPNKCLSMRKIREILRLKWDQGRSNRQIGKVCGISHNSVANYLARFHRAGLSWPLAEDLTDAELERKLFPPPPPRRLAKRRGVPDWAQVHRDLKRPAKDGGPGGDGMPERDAPRRKGMTLYLLWEEYKEQSPYGYEYSWFCHHYRKWLGKQDLVMRQEHRGGEKLFVDYSGMTVPVIDRATGELHQAQVFVAVLGASGYTYAEATWSQGLEDWITSHRNCFSWMEGCPEIVVPDNLRSAVSKAHRYEPDINPTYQDMATHYGVTVLPARVRRPRDKAAVELGVLLVQRWILAVLRKRRFFSLAEVNREIRRLLETLNNKPFRKLPGCRREVFEEIDRPALGPLPEKPYEFSEWKPVRVHVDYHVEFDRHYYSVPHELVGLRLHVRATRNTVECLHRGERVASHLRSRRPGRFTTVPAHMPEKHRQMGEWSPERLVAWAARVGPAARAAVEWQLANRKHPQQAYRTCLGILNLSKSYGDGRLDAACLRALELNSISYKSVHSILQNGLDQKAPEPVQESILPDDHSNIRGPSYYH